MRYNFEIERDVDKFRQDHYLNDSEPVNLYSLLLKLNVLTIFKPLSERFSGMCLKSSDKRFILINSRHSLCRQHFTIAHELYHLFIQERISPHYYNPEIANGKDPNEKKGDLFASNLLLPEKGFKLIIPPAEYDKRKISLSTILKLEHYFQVSHQSVLYRLFDLKLINKQELDAYLTIPIKRAAREYGYNIALYEPANCGLIIGDYGTKAKGLFDAEKISEGHYRSLMNDIGVDVTDIECDEKN